MPLPTSHKLHGSSSDRPARAREESRRLRDDRAERRSASLASHRAPRMASTNEHKNHHTASAGSRPLHEPAPNTVGGELEEIKPDQVGLPSRTVSSTDGNLDSHLNDKRSPATQDLMASVVSRSGAATKSLIDIGMALATLRIEVTEEIRVFQDDSKR